jgi:hypothetical protein
MFYRSVVCQRKTGVCQKLRKELKENPAKPTTPAWIDLLSFDLIPAQATPPLKRRGNLLIRKFLLIRPLRSFD